MIGGYEGSDVAADTVEIYDAATNAWSEGPALPEGLNHATGVAVGDDVYVVGGFRVHLGDISNHVYRLRAGAWEEVASMPQGRAAAAVAATEDHLYVVGGMGSAGDHEAHTLVEGEMLVYDIAADTWSVGPALGTHREHVAGTSIGDEVFVVGGRFGETNSNAAEVFDPVAGEWSAIAAVPTARSGLGLVAACDRYVVAIGGERIDAALTTFDAVEAYDPTTGEWRSLPPLRIPRHGLAVAAVGASLYALAGSDGGGSPVGTTAVEVLDLAPLLDGCGR